MKKEGESSPFPPFLFFWRGGAPKVQKDRREQKYGFGKAICEGRGGAKAKGKEDREGREAELVLITLFWNIINKSLLLFLLKIF